MSSTFEPNLARSKKLLQLLGDRPQHLPEIQLQQNKVAGPVLTEAAAGIDGVVSAMGVFAHLL